MVGVRPQPHSLPSRLGGRLGWGGPGSCAGRWPQSFLAGGGRARGDPECRRHPHEPLWPRPPWAFLAVALAPLLCARDGDCPCVQEEKKPLKEGVQDMLVKHHLFSWDIDG